MQKFRITHSYHTSDGILHLTITPKRNCAVFDFEPGQYASISFRRYGRPSAMRCFSITSSPNSRRQLEFAIRLDGDFTRSLARQPVGSTVYVRGPFGNFTLDNHYKRNMVLLAGGIGVTPFMSMIRFATEEQLPVRLVLLYSSSAKTTVPFRQDLLAHAKQNNLFDYALFTGTGPGPRNGGIAGRITAGHLRQLTRGNFNACNFLLCGPPSFVNAMRATLEAQGTDPEHIITEAFATKAATSNLLLPKDRTTRLTYAFSALALLVGTALITSVDLARYVPKYMSAVQAVSTARQTGTTPSAASPSSLTPAPVSSPPPSTDTSGATSSPGTTVTPAPTTTPVVPTNTYQPPITTVS